MKWASLAAWLLPLLAGAQAQNEWVALADQYRALRFETGHFDGAAWRPEIDAYDGAKHRLMQKLRLALMRAKPADTELLTRLGEPDARWRAGAPALRHVPGDLRAAVADEFWWYRWRGERDGLLVVLRNHRLELIAWSYALE